MSDNSNQMAFPLSNLDGVWAEGLTKRELFAAMAMQGLCTGSIPSPYLAADAVAYADAVLAELQKEQ